MKILKESVSDFPEFKAFITNLGKYNEGDLVGKWVKFPIDEDEFQKELESIGIGSTDEFGQPYEEWFVTDYDCELGDFGLGEYPGYDELERVGELVDSVTDAKAVANAMEVVDDIEEAIDGLDNGDITFYDGIMSMEDMAYELIDELGGLEEAVGEDAFETYFDYEGLGRDERINGGYEMDIDNASASLFFYGDEDGSNVDIADGWIKKAASEDIDTRDYDFKDYIDLEKVGTDPDVLAWIKDWYEGMEDELESKSAADIADEFLEDADQDQIAAICDKYIDKEAFGAYLDEDTYEMSDVSVSAGMYWCGSDNASDYDIGEEIVRQLGIEGINNKEYYFDYDAYGRDLQYDGFTLTSDGCIWDRR